MNTFGLFLFCAVCLALGLFMLVRPATVQRWANNESAGYISLVRFVGLLAILMGGFLLWARLVA